MEYYCEIYLGGQNIDDSWEIESLQLEKQFIQARIFTMNKNCFVIVYENDDRVNFDLVIQKNTLSLYSENNKLIKGKIVSVEAQYNLISILLKNNDILVHSKSYSSRDLQKPVLEFHEDSFDKLDDKRIYACLSLNNASICSFYEDSEGGIKVYQNPIVENLDKQLICAIMSCRSVWDVKHIVQQGHVNYGSFLRLLLSNPAINRFTNTEIIGIQYCLSMDQKSLYSENTDSMLLLQVFHIHDLICFITKSDLSTKINDNCISKVYVQTITYRILRFEHFKYVFIKPLFSKYCQQ
ncbi:hypothetical protein ROZALSC1DRAFT_24448 [Rozella allomycis CSF55]|uniref:Uncharacterized protein n=1 Tax=Rozella allomycis (strain CSF55) TaxID=988480 RepID=A0A4P9YDI1_ROZAC|nr:hypothetical protein ROZALSC1DRAFT_24448 [Rozella allomycis CSF55]